MAKLQLIRRLTEYYKLERFHTIWISAFAVFLNLKYEWKHSYLLSYGLLLVVFILFQGTYYWKLKLNEITGNIIGFRKKLIIFSQFRIINWILILIYPFLLWLMIRNNLLASQLNKGWGLFAYAFGLAEHINYYYIQLMYDNKNDWDYLRKYKKLKVAALRRDFRMNNL